MQRLHDFWASNKKLIVLSVLAVSLTASLLLINLLGINKGSSQSEANLAASSQDLSVLLADPELLPIKLLHWLSAWIPGNNLLASRLISVLLAGLSIALIVYIIKRWGGKRTAFFGFLVVVCSSWLLHIGRIGTADIVYYLALPSLIVSHLLLYDKPGAGRLAFWLAIQSLLLYIPGLVWFVLFNAFWQRAEISEAWSSARFWLNHMFLIVWPCVLLAPLIYGVALNPLNNTLTLAGMPNNLPNVLDSLQRAGETILFIGLGGEAPRALWLSSLPILDIFLMAALLTGIVFYARHWQAFRSRLLLTLFVVSLALISLGGPVQMSLLVPLLYIVLPTGIAYALHLWLKVFPNNPLIRSFGIGLIGLAVVTSCVYNLRSYFIAWPHHETTSTAFTERNLPDPRL